jgi:hypothetical protein
MFEGEYSHPLVRPTVFQAPMVSGYVTARLQWDGVPIASGYQDYATQVVLENIGENTFSVQMQQCSDYSATGPREAIGPAQSLVPLGRKTINILVSKPYLEFKASTATNQKANLKVQLNSKVRWNLMGFSELDPTYPTLQLTQSADSVVPSS